MSTRRLRARLDRVARSLDASGVPVQENEVVPDQFTIEPAMAQKLFEHEGRLYALKSKQRWEGGLTTDEVEEQRMLNERLSILATEVALPDPYGRDEVGKDHNRFCALRMKRLRKRPDLSDGERIEMIQLTARRIAYSYQTEEGRAWRRIEELSSADHRLRIVQIDELLELHKLYPPIPSIPGDLFDQSRCLTLEQKLEGLAKEKLRYQEYAKRFPDRIW